MKGELFNKPYELEKGTPGTYGVETVGSAKVNLNGKIEIITNGEENYGIYAGKNGEINLNSGKKEDGTNTDLTIIANGIKI